MIVFFKMDISNITVIINTCHALIQQLHVLAIPPPPPYNIELNVEGLQAIVMEGFTKLMSVLPVLPPRPLTFPQLMEFQTQENVNYQGYNLYQSLIRDPQRFWSLTSK